MVDSASDGLFLEGGTSHNLVTFNTVTGSGSTGIPITEASNQSL